MAAQARMVLRSRRSAALATTLTTEAGWPYASLVTVACDTDGSPDSATVRAFRSYAQSGSGSARLAAARGRKQARQSADRAAPDPARRIVPDTEPRLRRMIPGATSRGRTVCRLCRFPHLPHEHEARPLGRRFRQGALAGCPGRSRRCRCMPGVGGGRADRPRAYERGTPIPSTAGRWLLGRGGSGWRMIGVDPDGCDLARGTACARLAFPYPVGGSGELRAILVDLDRAASPSA